MLALGETVSTAGDRQMIERASRLFVRALPAAKGVAAIRAQSSVLLGCQAALPILADRPTTLAHRSIAQRLESAFDRVAGSAWPWPEARLTYENALPVRALLEAGIRLESAPMIRTGLNVLDWLIAVQLAPAGQAWPALKLAAVLGPAGIPGSILTAVAAAGYITGLARVTEADQLGVQAAYGNLEQLGLIRIATGDAVRTVWAAAALQESVRRSMDAAERRRTVRVAADAILGTWPAAGPAASTVVGIVIACATCRDELAS